MSATLYLMKETTFEPIGDVKIENVLKLSVGQRLVYVEYAEGDYIRIRAYGRDEFKFLGIDRGDNSDGHLLDMENITRMDMRFPRPVEETPVEETEAVAEEQ